MKARRPRRNAWITWGSNANEDATIPAWAALKPRYNNVIREANQVRMGEGREDRTQIEDVITLPKTDHKVGKIT